MNKSKKDLAKQFCVDKEVLNIMIPKYLTPSGSMYDEADIETMLQQNEENLRIKLASKEMYTNEELHLIFKCGTQGGMRRAKETNSLVLITFDPDSKKSIYKDCWIDDVLHYTGMGQNGHQTFEDANQNKTLFLSRELRIFITLFTNTTVNGVSKYVYRGEVILSDDPYYDHEKGEDGEERQVCKFPLKIVNEPQYHDEQVIEAIEKEKFKSEKIYTKRLSAEELRKRALKKGKKGKPAQRNNTTAGSRKPTYKREESVKIYAITRARGICECCGQPAPFEVDGEPFLVCHHIKWLERNGEDSIYNTCGICPNCHSKIHALDLQEDTETIIRNMKDDEFALSGILI